MFGKSRLSRKQELDYLEKHGIIMKVPTGVPTPWCSQIHVVHKKDGHNVRICIDPKFLNKALLREYHPIKTMEDITTQVQGSKVYTKLDANMGFFSDTIRPGESVIDCFQHPLGEIHVSEITDGCLSSPGNIPKENRGNI